MRLPEANRRAVTTAMDQPLRPAERKGRQIGKTPGACAAAGNSGNVSSRKLKSGSIWALIEGRHRFSKAAKRRSSRRGA